MADIATVNREPTPIQAAARGAADVLLAGNAPLVPPGKYTVRWNQIAKLVEVKPGGDWAKAADMIDLLLVTKTGQKLLDELIPRLKRAGAAGAKIHVHVMERKDFPERTSKDAAGYFIPEDAGEPRYDVFVMTEKDLRPSDLFNRGETGKLRRGKSFMAHSLFHEMLHVWFVHAFPGEGTGHEGGVMHPEFGKRIEAVTKDLEKLEQAR